MYNVCKQSNNLFLYGILVTSCMLNERKKENVFAYISLSYHPLQCNLMPSFNIQTTQQNFDNQTEAEFYEASVFLF